MVGLHGRTRDSNAELGTEGERSVLLGAEALNLAREEEEEGEEHFEHP